MSEQHPDISVIVTLYNYAHYIKDTVNSFIKQDYTNAEMIIIDDASRDNPLSVLSPILEKDNRIKYIRLDNNLGYSAAKNYGIKNAKSDVLVMLDADDMLTSNSLTKRFEKLKQGYDLVHGPVLDLRDKKTSESKLWKQWIKSKKDASCYRFIHAQSVMLKKEIHRIIGLYDESMRSKSDREMWARVLNHKFKVGWVDEYVAVYRMHPNQMHRSKEKLKVNDKLQKDLLLKISRRKKDLSDIVLLTG